MEDNGPNSGLWQRDLANLKRILWVEVRGIKLFKRGKLLSRLVLRSHWYDYGSYIRVYCFPGDLVKKSSPANET